MTSFLKGTQCNAATCKTANDLRWSPFTKTRGELRGRNGPFIVVFSTHQPPSFLSLSVPPFNVPWSVAASLQRLPLHIASNL